MSGKNLPPENLNTSPGLVSVIVTAFNIEDYIEETLASIMNQSHTNFECIVVNDASTDGTLARIQSATKSDPRFRIIHLPENVGPAGARNAGLKEVKGEVLSFLDGDDMWHPDFLEIMQSTLTSAVEPVIGCFCWSSRVDVASRPLNSVITPQQGYYDLARYLSGICPPGNGSSLMLRTSHLNGREFKNMCAEDTMFCLELLSSSKDALFYCIPDVLVSYRDSPASLSKVFHFGSAQRVASLEYRMARFLPQVEARNRPLVALKFAKRLIYIEKPELDPIIDKWIKATFLEGSISFFTSKDGVYFLLLRLLRARIFKKLRRFYQALRSLLMR